MSCPPEGSPAPPNEQLARSVDLSPLISPASFWWPRLIVESAWLQHAPFAFWLVGALQPKTIVELGTHSGFSYFAFCQAVAEHDLACRCFAVDHWLGDEHAGFYDDAIYSSVEWHNEEFSEFSSLIREDFRDASRRFADRTVDLLHIDGRHFYEDVKQDFETWLPKLSTRAVVLFHDTSVLEGDFGVNRFWAELIQHRPGFAFAHGNGLGILGYGESLPHEMTRFLNATLDQDTALALEGAYQRLGVSISAQHTLRKLKEEATATTEELHRIRTSASWRLTSPLRSIRRMVRGFALRTRKR